MSWPSWLTISVQRPDPPDPEAVAAAVFAALAEPTRRAILAALAARGPATATGLASQLPITRQAITKHLELLAAAGLVRSEPGERRRIPLPRQRGADGGRPVLPGRAGPGLGQQAD